VSGNSNPRRFDVAATLACFGALGFWSLGPNCIEYLTKYLDAWTQNSVRYCIACLFWLPFLCVSICRKQVDRGIWRRALLPAVPNIVMQSLWAAAFYYIDPAFMVLLSKTSIVWIAGFSLIFFSEERVLIRSRRFWAGLGLCVVGVAGVLYFKEDFGGRRTTIGVLIGLACAFLWGMYAVTVRMVFRDTDSRNGFAVISIYTVVGLGVLGAIFGDIRSCLDLTVRPWIVLVGSAIMCIALAHVLYYSAMRRIGATIPALVILAQPFAVLAISHLAFGESLTELQFVFGVMLLIGAGLAIWSQQALKR